MWAPCSGGDRLVQLGDAVDVRLDRELEARGGDSTAELDDVHRRELPDEVVERREAEAEAAVPNQPGERAVPERHYGQAAADVLVGLVGKAGVEVGSVQGRVEAGPAEVVLRQRGK